MDPRVVFGFSAAIGGIYTIFWAWNLAGAHTRSDYAPVYKSLKRTRRVVAYAMIVASVGLFAVSSSWLPYSQFKVAALGQPQITVSVVASQFFWNISKVELPSGVPIEFDVTSKDVNHGFAIYNPSGSIIAQVQAMPGYVNKLIVVFDAPGTYVIHCLEYCGVDHHEMERSLAVT